MGLVDLFEKFEVICLHQLLSLYYRICSKFYKYGSLVVDVDIWDKIIDNNGDL